MRAEANGATTPGRSRSQVSATAAGCVAWAAAISRSASTTAKHSGRRYSATIEERAVVAASPCRYFPVRKPAASEKYGTSPMSWAAATSPRFPGPSTSPR